MTTPPCRMERTRRERTGVLGHEDRGMAVYFVGRR
jgi:hypothetical protein